MKKKKEKNRYYAEYDDNELRLNLEKVNFRIDLTNDLEVGVLVAKFRQAGLGSSRELGRLFNRSASTVINKDRFSRNGNKGLVDGRGQRRQYKIEEIRGEIFYLWGKNPLAEDREILEGLQPRLSSLGIGLELKTLKGFLREIGIAEARSRIRVEESLSKGDMNYDNNVQCQDNEIKRADEDEEKEIIQTHSRYAGQMLHVPQLYKMNFAQMVKGLPSPADEDCVYTIQQVGHQICFLYASGGKRLYDLDSLDHRGFGALIGMEDNLRSSGMNKRVRRMAKAEAVEVFQEKALAGRIVFISIKDLRLCYSDTHVVEVWVSELIAMARHGTKNKQVKAMNVHYLIGSDTGTPLVKEYTAGNKRLHWSIPHLVKRADKVLKDTFRKVGIVCYDKGGISLKALKELIRLKKGFLC